MADWRLRIAGWFLGSDYMEKLAAVTAVVDDSGNWQAFGGRPHDRAAGENQKIYADTLEAWRKNPLAWNAVRITTDYILGDKLSISSSDENMQRFIDLFWEHPKNRMDNRLQEMSEELTRAGDLFPVLFLNKADGMSYIRFITKDEVEEIETAANDWEDERILKQLADDGVKRWYFPSDGRAKRATAVVLHYPINRPIGATFGESDLVAVLPWLLRYSRFLEDRVRLNWAVRAFLWFVRVPTNMVAAKKEQYKTPPEPGSVVVMDDAEEWEAKTPNLRAQDANHDLKALGNMVDAGTGYPPHWRGVGGDVNFATAQAMQEPVEKHLKRRQKYFAWVLQDILFTAYQRARAVRPEMWPALGTDRYSVLFSNSLSDVSSADNERLANAADKLATAVEKLAKEYPGSSRLKRLLLKLVLKFAGEPQDEAFLDDVMGELDDTAVDPLSVYGRNGKGDLHARHLD
ncbi:MAG: phage portal protein [Methanophagales archaeon]|nr:phage portal protein [Methanophagales archaeon]